MAKVEGQVQLALKETDIRTILFLIGARQKDIRKVEEHHPNFEVFSKLDTRLAHLTNAITEQI